MTNGCDISYAQQTVDFDALRSEVSFVIVKATEGVGFTDPTFARNWREAKRVGLRRGAYHFVRADLGNSAQAEAGWFLSQLGPLDSDDMLALDYEIDWTGEVVGWCKTWLDLVRSVTGITPYLYLNRSYLHLAWTPALGYPLWLADYDQQPGIVPAPPWPSVAIKQWTSIGSLAGIAGNVDLNTMEEDMADETTIREWAKAEARVVLAKEYGPALEGELQQRFADVVQKIEAELAALPTNGTSDDHIKGVVLQTVRAVFDSVSGNMPQP